MHDASRINLKICLYALVVPVLFSSSSTTAIPQFIGRLLQGGIAIDYYMSTDQLSFHDAVRSCETRLPGGRLGLPTNQQQNDYITEYITSTNDVIRYVWINLNDEHEEGAFVNWKGDTVYNKSIGRAIDDNFVDFQGNEPNDSGGNEDYVAILWGNWHDYSGNNGFHYLCEVSWSTSQRIRSGISQQTSCRGYIEQRNDLQGPKARCHLACVMNPYCIGVTLTINDGECEHVLLAKTETSTTSQTDGNCYLWTRVGGCV